MPLSFINKSIPETYFYNKKEGIIMTYLACCRSAVVLLTLSAFTLAACEPLPPENIVAPASQIAEQIAEPYPALLGIGKAQRLCVE